MPISCCWLKTKRKKKKKPIRSACTKRLMLKGTILNISLNATRLHCAWVDPVSQSPTVPWGLYALRCLPISTWASYLGHLLQTILNGLAFVKIKQNINSITEINTCINMWALLSKLLRQLHWGNGWWSKQYVKSCPPVWYASLIVTIIVNLLVTRSHQ